MDAVETGGRAGEDDRSWLDWGSAGVRLKLATFARLWSSVTNGPLCRLIRSRPYYPRDLLEARARSQISDVRTGDG